MVASQTDDGTGRRKGRGSLSSIDKLPEVCDEHIAWANIELRERRIPQTEILREFNSRIADHGCKPISKGAFSRYSVRKAIEVRKMEAARDVANAVMAKFPIGDRNDATLAAIELVKFRVIELIMDGDSDMGQLAKASLILTRAVKAQGGVASLKGDEDSGKEAKPSAPAGVSDETLSKINRVLGIG